MYESIASTGSCNGVEDPHPKWMAYHLLGANQGIGKNEVSDLCPVCGKTFNYTANNHGSMILYIHEQVPSDNFFDKARVVSTRTYRCCFLVKGTGEKSRGYFCTYP